MTPTPLPRAQVHRLALFAVLASLVVCTAAFGADDKAKKHRGYVDGSTFVDLIDSDGRLIEVTMDRKLLRLFSGRAMKRRESVIADLLGNLEGINAVIGDVTKFREETDDEIARVQEGLEKKGWERFVRVREPGSGDFAAWILANDDDEEEVDGLVVIGFQENDEMMFVNLCGRIDMESIALLGEEMGLPGLPDLPSRSEVEKRREEERRQRGDAARDDDSYVAPQE